LKKITSIIVLAVFVFQSTTSFIVLVSFVFNRTYIADNICVNRFDKIPVCKGQCYLTKELKQQAHQEKSFPDLLQKELQLFFQISSTYRKVNVVASKVEHHFYGVDTHYSIDFNSSVFRPPQVA